MTMLRVVGEISGEAYVYAVTPSPIVAAVVVCTIGKNARTVKYGTRVVYEWDESHGREFLQISDRIDSAIKGLRENLRQIQLMSKPKRRALGEGVPRSTRKPELRKVGA